MSKLEGKTFAVLSYRVSAAGVSSLMYEVCFHPSKTFSNCIITHEEAMEIVEEFQLIPHRLDGGTIWDTPMQSFNKRFQNHFSRTHEQES